MSDSSIVIRGAREHNLRDIDVSIPRDQLVVITGLSGSGKSSLAFDTIYAEGQRRYVESLSSYARQFLGQMDKPDLDSIDGLSPAVSIDQKTTSKNPRSTVGTVTEIYDYLRLLFARVGTPHCPECGRVIERQTTDQVADKVLAAGEGRRAFVLAPVVRGRKGEYTKLFEDLRAEGFSRVRVDGEVRSLDDPIDLDKKFKHDIEVVVDRIVIRENSLGRIAESVEQATALAHGNVNVYMLPDRDAPEGTEGELLEYSLALACPEHGHSIDDLQPRDFSFNAPYGACPECDGLGFKKTVDAEALIEDPSKSIADGVFGSLFGNSNYYPQIFAAVCKHFKVSADTPWEDLPPRVRRAFLDGLGDTKISVDYQKLDGRRSQWDTKFSGVRNILFERYTETTNENTKARLEKYIREEPCSTCHGARLRSEMLAVTVGGKSIYEVCCLSCRESLEFFEGLELTERQQFIGGRIVKEILERLRFLVDVGLDYLTLDRASATLSGGEAQRIRLATQIGAGLMGVLYILDEPSIGLHQRDNERLIKTLERLRDIGNTVVVVEHDEDIIRAADYIIDIGPLAGRLGGEVVYQGGLSRLPKATRSYTMRYLTGESKIELPANRRKWNQYIEVEGAAQNNLKSIDVKFPLHVMTVVSGVSGSGKSSLVRDVFYRALLRHYGEGGEMPGTYSRLSGDMDRIHSVEFVDQNPIGKSTRSNPATYLKAFDEIRKLFAEQQGAKQMGFSPSYFSFNSEGGRCEECKGEGTITVEMQFMADIVLECESCHGKRYKQDVLDIEYRGKNISDVLDMTINQAIEFFSEVNGSQEKRIIKRLKPLQDVGLGYIKLGQSSSTLSGGENQRVKLAFYLSQEKADPTMFIFDEPTTGLHFHDIRKLLDAFDALIRRGHSIVIIEHNMDVIKCADYVIDLGPEGGDKGGNIVAVGTPEEVAACGASYTGQFLKEKLR